MWYLASQPKCSPSRRRLPISRRRSKSHRLLSRPDLDKCRPQDTTLQSLVNRRRTRQPMGLSQYHTTLAHVTPRGRPHTLGCTCTMGADHHTEAPQAQVILPKLHHHAEGLVPRRRSKSRRRVSIYRYRSVTPITQHKFV